MENGTHSISSNRVQNKDSLLWGSDCRGEQDAYLIRSFAYLTGTARFDPPKSLSTAKFMPITFPSRLKSGPPEPPEVVAAS
jgi:hypothetical protein